MQKMSAAFMKNVVGGATQTINFGTGLSKSDAGIARKEFIASCKADGIRIVAHGYNGSPNKVDFDGKGWWVTIRQ